jgi:hypothetical protein
MPWMRTPPPRADVGSVGPGYTKGQQESRGGESREARVNTFGVDLFIKPRWQIRFFPGVLRERVSALCHSATGLSLCTLSAARPTLCLPSRCVSFSAGPFRFRLHPARLEL